jgi:hypothetical protein
MPKKPRPPNTSDAARRSPTFENCSLSPANQQYRTCSIHDPCCHTSSQCFFVNSCRSVGHAGSEFARHSAQAPAAPAQTRGQGLLRRQGGAERRGMLKRVKGNLGAGFVAPPAKRLAAARSRQLPRSMPAPLAIEVLHARGGGGSAALFERAQAGDCVSLRRTPRLLESRPWLSCFRKYQSWLSVVAPPQALPLNS